MSRVTIQGAFPLRAGPGNATPMHGAPTQDNRPYQGPTWVTTLPPWLLFSAVGIALFWLPAAVLNLFVAGNYLPSTVWLDASRPYVYLLWSVCAAAYFLFGLIGSKSIGANAYVDAIFLTAVMFGFTFVPVSNLVYSGVPSFIASVVGGEVEHQFQVSAVDQAGYKWCHNPLELDGMPFMTALCEAKEIRSTLSPRQTVAFGGQGTWMGLYVDYMLQPDSMPTALPHPRPPR